MRRFLQILRWAVIIVPAGIRLIGLPVDVDRARGSFEWWESIWNWAVNSDEFWWVILGLVALLTLTLDAWPALQQCYYRWRGVPMTVAIRDRLTFGEIATRWASELEGHPGEISRDEILGELLSGVWNGHFEDKRGNSHLTLVHLTNNIFREQNYGEWNRKLLLSAIYQSVRRGLEDTPLPARDEIETTENSHIPWQEIGRLPPNVYEDLHKTAYIEPLLVSQLDFKRWARKSSRVLPKFWFG